MELFRGITEIEVPKIDCTDSISKATGVVSIKLDESPSPNTGKTKMTVVSRERNKHARAAEMKTYRGTKTMKDVARTQHTAVGTITKSKIDKSIVLDLHCCKIQPTLRHARVMRAAEGELETFAPLSGALDIRDAPAFFLPMEILSWRSFSRNADTRCLS